MSHPCQLIHSNIKSDGMTLSDPIVVDVVFVVVVVVAVVVVVVLVVVEE